VTDYERRFSGGQLRNWFRVQCVLSKFKAFEALGPQRGLRRGLRRGPGRGQAAMRDAFCDATEMPSLSSGSISRSSREQLSK